MKTEIFDQIKRVTQLVRDAGLSLHERYPMYSTDRSEIVWEGYKNLAFTHKDETYQLIYEKCLEARDFNILMLDAALIQLRYCFNRKGIAKHVLTYYPNPNVEKYIDSPTDYEERFLGNTLFSEISNKAVIAFPMRFDFDSTSFTEEDHSYSHATFGNYQGCRIPVRMAISPNRFVHFILRSFYFDIFRNKFSSSDFSCALKIPESITAIEKKLIHFSFE